MLYVYGVVRAGQPPPDRAGIGRPPRPVRVIASGPVAALVSELPNDYELDEDDARTQLHVLIDALRAGPVLPMRLGTAAENEDSVRRDVLDADADALAAELDGLDGMVELELDADDDEAEVLAALADQAPVPSSAADLAGRIEVGQQIAAMVVAHRQARANEIVEQLRHISVDDVARATVEGPEDPVLRWAFLVRADDLERFDAAVAKLRAAYPDLQFRYVGPVPAAHFVGRRARASTPAADSFRGTGSWGW